MRDYSVNSNRKPSHIRSDASANRKSIVLAARKLFAAKGPEVPLTEITKEAGVSRATLYRNFPDRVSIIMEVFQYNLNVLEAYSQKIEKQRDRFFKLMEVIIDQQAKYQSLASSMGPMGAQLQGRVFQIFAKPIEEAKKSGSLRKDFVMERDLILLLMMLGGALLMPDGTDKADRMKRALTFVKEGIKK